MLSSFFARRYLFSRKSHSVINIISGVSALAVSVPVAAMVILLSVFNGFEGLVKSMYNDFDPDVMVGPARGKTFAVTDSLDRRLTAVPAVAARSYLIEDNVMVEYRGGQSIATVRGVDSMYAHVVPIGSMVQQGEYALHFGSIEQALVGQGLAYNLGVNVNVYDYITVYAPRRGSFNSVLPLESYRSGQVLPAGTFMLDTETDTKYMIVPLDFTRRLLDYPDRATNIAVKLTPGADPDKAAQQIAAALGGQFRALTRYQQKASLYRIMRYEKWSIFLIITLVMVISSFSIIGSLVMLIIDKREDIRTLVTMGGTVRLLRAIFARQGMLITAGGGVAGMAVGVGVCLLQQHYGLVRIPSDTMLVDSYPVILQGSDLAVVALVFAGVSLLIVRLTVARMIPKNVLRF